MSSKKRAAEELLRGRRDVDALGNENRRGGIVGKGGGVLGDIIATTIFLSSL